MLKDARFFLQNVHWHVALFFCACACFDGMDGIQESHFVCSLFFQFWSHIKPLESHSLERNENDVTWNHAPGVRQELEEERKKHSESKEGAHAANPSMDTSDSREPIGLCDFRVKHPDLTAF